MVSINATNIDILTWYYNGDYISGIILFLVGIIGGLVTLYFYIGNLLPNMGGSTRINDLETESSQLKTRIEDLKKIWNKEREDFNDMIEGNDKQGSSSHPLEKKCAAQKMQLEEITKRIGQMENDLREKEQNIINEKNSMLRIGFILYALLGGAFSTLIATDALQGVIIGAGWTTFASTIGLKRQEEQVKSKKEELTSNYVRENEYLNKVLSETGNKLSEYEKMISNLRSQHDKTIEELLDVIKEKGKE
jgi:hypothetical protein